MQYIANELELAHSSLKSIMQNPHMGPLPVPEYWGNELALAHPAQNGLLHETLAWACSRRASEKYACIGLWHKCTDIIDGLKFAHSSLKALMYNLHMGPLPGPEY